MPVCPCVELRAVVCACEMMCDTVLACSFLTEPKLCQYAHNYTCITTESILNYFMSVCGLLMLCAISRYSSLSLDATCDLSMLHWWLLPKSIAQRQLVSEP